MNAVWNVINSAPSRWIALSSKPYTSTKSGVAGLLFNTGMESKSGYIVPKTLRYTSLDVVGLLFNMY